jgi:hypothetical protein
MLINDIYQGICGGILQTVYFILISDVHFIWVILIS